MFTTGQRNFTNFVCLISIFWSTCLYGYHEHHSTFEWLELLSELNQDEDPSVDYEEYGEFGDILKEFDRLVDDYDSSIDGEFFLFKWGKKMKKWIKNTARQMCLRMLGLHDLKKSSNNAYTIARFKRIFDQISDTGPLSDLIEGIEKELPADGQGLNSFLAQVKYYHKNKDKRPDGEFDPGRYDQSVDLEILMLTEEELKDVDPEYIWAYLEVGCGVLLCAIPFPPAQWLGRTLITSGVSQFAYAYYKNMDEENRKKKNAFRQSQIEFYLKAAD